MSPMLSRLLFCTLFGCLFCSATLVSAQVPDAPGVKPAESAEGTRQVDRSRLQQLGGRLRQRAVEASNLKSMTWKIGETEREALVYFPPVSKTPAPVVFAFHGHGGTSGYAARKFAIHEIWPEAICVYPQGLPTPGAMYDPEGKRAGWQKFQGDQDDRDLKLFDAILESLHKEREIDDHRIYVTGHSNGGFFSYVLWASRGEQLAAIAPIAGASGLLAIDQKRPLPVMIIAGEKDEIVPFSVQQRTMDRVRKNNGCEPEGKKIDPETTEYASKQGAPVVIRIHPGAHEVPADAPRQIVEFFKQRRRE